MLSLHRSLKTRQVREMDIIRTNHQEIDQELFAKAVKEIVYRSPSIVWLSTRLHFYQYIVLLLQPNHHDCNRPFRIRHFRNRSGVKTNL